MILSIDVENLYLEILNILLNKFFVEYLVILRIKNKKILFYNIKLSRNKLIGVFYENKK